MGVRGIKLREGDKVVGAATSREETLLFITAKGYGKRTKLDEFRRAGRGGLGVKALKVTEAKGDLIGAGPVDEDTEVMLCLLYTSPSPRDLSTSRMPSSA